MSNIPMMKRFTLATMIAAVVFGIAGLIGSANAAPGGVPGPPNGGGGDGAAPDFGDLIILYRDDFGVPFPSPEVQVEDPETGELVDGGLCWQPIAFNVSDEPDTLCPTSCLVPSVPAGEDVVDVNQYNCGVATGCSGCTQEVDFGRINEARSPDDVFESQLEDVVVNLATADCRTLDPAGRMVASRVADDETVSSSTIDSPLQNLAISRQLLLTGTIGAPLPQGADVLDTAARGIGAGSGKTGEVNVDLVAYLDQLMGLTAPGTVTILDPKLCETYREEVQGVIQLVEKCFLDYRNYEYARTTNFVALPAPAYIPEGAPAEGWFEYLALVPGTDPPLFGIEQGLITTAVFGDAEATDGNIGGYAQAADDARAVINFMHDWPMPDADVYGTPVPCIADPEADPRYDVSISEESGLQVPVTYINGTDREFIVSVANAGPDAATGTVTVTATPENVDTIEGSPWTFEFIDLAVGASESWTTFFSIDLGARTTINWTAEADAEFDVNDVNDIVTATTNVRTTGGGGGGGGGRR